MVQLQDNRQSLSILRGIWRVLPYGCKVAAAKAIISDLSRTDRIAIIDLIVLLNSPAEPVSTPQAVRTYQYQQALAKQTREGWLSQFIEFFRSAFALLVWGFAVFGLVSFLSLVVFRRFI